MKAVCWHGRGDVRVEHVPERALCDNSNPNAWMLERLYGQSSSACRSPMSAPSRCRTILMGGVVSIPGVYGGYLDTVPFGAAFAKGLTLKMGQTHVHRYLPALTRLIQEHRVDPTTVISHRLSLDDAPEAYRMFRDKRHGCTKVVMRPS
jgi:hypothetical protein